MGMNLPLLIYSAEYGNVIEPTIYYSAILPVVTASWACMDAFGLQHETPEPVQVSTLLVFPSTVQVSHSSVTLSFPYST
jgi:hypothetical protein